MLTPGTAVLGGVVTGDGLGGLVTVSQGGTTVVPAVRTAAGRYDEAVTGLTGAAAANYQLSPTGNQTGVATITPKPVTWSVGGAAFVQGGPPVIGAATLTGVLPGDAVFAVVILLRGGTMVAAVKSLAPGAYDEVVTTLEGGDNRNYVIASAGNRTGTLSVAPPVVMPPLQVPGTGSAPAPTAPAPALSGSVESVPAIVEPTTGGTVSIAPPTDGGRSLGDAGITASLALVSSPASGRPPRTVPLTGDGAAAGATGAAMAGRVAEAMAALPAPVEASPSSSTAAVVAPDGTVAAIGQSTLSDAAVARTTADAAPPQAEGNDGNNAPVAPALASGAAADPGRTQATDPIAQSVASAAGDGATIGATALATAPSVMGASTAAPAAVQDAPPSSGRVVPMPDSAAVAVGQIALFSAAIAGAAAVAGMPQAEAEAAIGAQVNLALASGASPGDAMVRAAAAGVQLAASVGGDLSAAGVMAAALAGGTMTAANTALAAGLAGGLTPGAALRQAAAAAAEHAAMTQKAASPLSPGGLLVATLATGAGVDQGPAVAALAAGLPPAAALNSAAAMTASRGAMEAIAILPETPARRSAIALASGDTGSVLAAMGGTDDPEAVLARWGATLLAAGYPIDALETNVARASAALRRQRAAGLVPLSSADARRAAMSRGEAWADETAARAREAQLASSIVGAPDEDLLARAQGRLAPAAASRESDDDMSPLERLRVALARGTATIDTFIAIGITGDPSRFAVELLASLAAGRPLPAAIYAARPLAPAVLLPSFPLTGPVAPPPP